MVIGAEIDRQRNIPLKGAVQNQDFGSRSRRAGKVCRRHILTIPRIKYPCARLRLSRNTIFQGGLKIIKVHKSKHDNGML